MSCEELTTATSIKLDVLTPEESGDTRYSLDFGVSVPANATRAEYVIEGKKFTVWLACFVEAEGSAIEFTNMPLGWNDTLLACGVEYEAEVTIYSCTTDSCCGENGEPIEMPTIDPGSAEMGGDTLEE